MKGLRTRDGSLKLSNEDGHGYTTIQAYTQTDSFYNYIQTNNLIDTLLRYVAEADTLEENYYITHLNEQYPTVDIWPQQQKPNEVYHTYGVVSSKLTDDPRLHNSVECLNLAIEQKRIDDYEAIRVLSYGIHLLQDYFTHLNAPGIGDTGVSHGVNVMIDTDGDEIPDQYAGFIVDNINWDCHSMCQDQSTQDQYDFVNLFNANDWHYHQNRSDSWRYLAAYHTTIKYMEAFSADDSTVYTDSLIDGRVTNREVTLNIDLLAKTKINR